MEDRWTSRPALDFHDEEAARISKEIDAGLLKEAEKQQELRKTEIKVLLLGQAESGKSTLQKQFQILYAPQTFGRERSCWIGVVYLNVIASLKKILEGISQACCQTSDEQLAINHPTTDIICQDICELKTNLGPLLECRRDLSADLSFGQWGRISGLARTGWQTSNTDTWKSVAVVCTENIIVHKKEDIQSLWRHPFVVRLIRERRIDMQETAPYFMENLDRICAIPYIPTFDDILHVRMQTLGVTQHTFFIPHGNIRSMWRMYDVAGARGQRDKWAPFFEEANAILFLAPISAFDQTLEEDSTKMRMDDSLELFGKVCENILLRKASLILFLNKIDILRRKISEGAKVDKYISGFSGREHTAEEVAEYFHKHFCKVHRRMDLSKRHLFVHLTCMLDTTAVAPLINTVTESILIKHLDVSLS